MIRKESIFGVRSCTAVCQQSLRKAGIFVHRDLVLVIVSNVYDQLTIYRSAILADRSLLLHSRSRKQTERVKERLAGMYPRGELPVRHLPPLSPEELHALVALEERAREEGDETAVSALSTVIRIHRP